MILLILLGAWGLLGRQAKSNLSRISLECFFLDFPCMLQLPNLGSHAVVSQVLGSVGWVCAGFDVRFVRFVRRLMFEIAK